MHGVDELDFGSVTVGCTHVQQLKKASAALAAEEVKVLADGVGETGCLPPSVLRWGGAGTHTIVAT